MDNFSVEGAKINILETQNIRDLLAFDPDQAGLPTVRRKKVRPSSAAVKNRSSTHKNGPPSRPGSRQRSRPASAMRSRTRKSKVVSQEPDDEQFVRDFKQKSKINYNSNRLDRVRVDRQQDAWEMVHIEKAAEMYAGVDKQIRDRALRDEYEAEQERIYDNEFERSRKKEMERDALRLEHKKNMDTYTYNQAYMDDMENRRIRMFNEQSEKDRDRQHVHRMTEEYEADVRRKKDEKSRRARRLKEEAIEYQDKQAKQRLRKSKEEKDDEARVVTHQKEKLMRENILEQEKLRKKREAEMLTAKLRSKQKKSADVKGQRDEELMIRHQRDHALNEYRRIKKEMKNRAERERDVLNVRAQQVRQKAEQVAHAAQLERKQHETMMTLQDKERLRVHNEEQKIKDKKEQYRQDLLAQIASNEAARTKSKIENRSKEAVERVIENDCINGALEDARRAKLTELRKQGIPEHYAQRLLKYQFKHI